MPKLIVKRSKVRKPVWKRLLTLFPALFPIVLLAGFVGQAMVNGFRDPRALKLQAPVQPSQTPPIRIPQLVGKAGKQLPQAQSFPVTPALLKAGKTGIREVVPGASGATIPEDVSRISGKAADGPVITEGILLPAHPRLDVPEASAAGMLSAETTRTITVSPSPVQGKRQQSRQASVTQAPASRKPGVARKQAGTSSVPVRPQQPVQDYQLLEQSLDISL